MKTTLVLLLIAFSLSLSYSAPYNGYKMNFKQPDGSLVEVLLYGDEFYMRGESLDGYTLIRDKSNGWICYAKLSEDRTELLSTGIKYKTGVRIKSTIQLEKHLDIDAETQIKIIENKRQKLLRNHEFKLKSAPLIPKEVKGKIIGLTILVDFSDAPHDLPVAAYDSMLNANNYTEYDNHGSAKEFFSDISYGLVDYENIVLGWFRAPKTYKEYDAIEFPFSSEELLDTALHWAEAQGFDFSKLSVDKWNRIRALNLIVTGVPQNWYTSSLWPHSNAYTNFSADGVKTDWYNVSQGFTPLNIHVFCHENGHSLCGWMDTYQYDRTEDGIGRWDLMCGEKSKEWFINMPPNPHFRNLAGWSEEIPLTKPGRYFSVANDKFAFIYRNPERYAEYYLIENRLKKGQSRNVRDEGLTIWHIDETKKYQAVGIEEHRVYIEHAYNSPADHEHTCYKAGFIDEFGSHTLPSSNWHDGSECMMTISNVSSVGDTIYFDFNIKSDLIDKSKLKILPTENYKFLGSINAMIDANPRSYYQFTPHDNYSNSLIIELDSRYDLTGFRYLPLIGDSSEALQEFNLLCSNDLKVWDTIIYEGKFAANDSMKFITLNHEAQFIKLKALKNEKMDASLRFAEMDFFGSVVRQAPAKPENINPGISAELVDMPVNIRWKPRILATSYDLYLSEDSLIDSTDFVSSITDTLYLKKDLKYFTDYYWRVDAINQYGTTKGDVWSFRTKGDNLAVGKTVTASSEYGFGMYKPEFAVDGDVSSKKSRWFPKSGEGYPHWLEVDFGFEDTISSFKIYTGNNGYNTPLIDFSFQVWSGDAWVDAMVIEGNESSVLYVNLPTPVITQKVRLYITKAHNDQVRLYEFEVNKGEIVTSSPKVNKKSPFRLYPNPATQSITIDKQQFSPADIEILGLNGQTIYNGTLTGNKKIIDLSEYPTGIYFITIKSDDYIWTKRFVKL